MGELEGQVTEKNLPRISISPHLETKARDMQNIYVHETLPQKHHDNAQQTFMQMRKDNVMKFESNLLFLVDPLPPLSTSSETVLCV